MDYKSRIEKIMSIEKLNATQLASEIGIQGSTLSHVLNGRNKPSLELLTKILKRFPMYNSDWLILGKDPMLRQESKSHMPSLFDFENDSAIVSAGYIQNNEPKIVQEKIPLQEKIIAPNVEDTNLFVTDKKVVNESATTPVHTEIQKERKIEKIIIYFSDNTYQNFLPG